jgi:hypothetical protein
MPIIAVQVNTLKDPKRQQANFRATLLKAGIPEYSYKEKRDGFEVWHAEDNEGETKIIWHTFTEDSELSTAQERAGLKACANILMDNYWVQMYRPDSQSLRYGRMHLRVLLSLSWLK